MTKHEGELKHEAGKSVELDAKQYEKLNEQAAERRREAAEKASNNQESLEKIRENIEKVAAPKEKLQAETSRAETAGSDKPFHASTLAKGRFFQQTMKSVQRHETKSERRFSKIIHQPVVEEVSNIAGATIARPSGLLIGGLFSVISSGVILYVCRHYGYEYNFLVGIAALAGGFAVGLLLEGFWKAVTFKKK